MSTHVQPVVYDPAGDDTEPLHQEQPTGARAWFEPGSPIRKHLRTIIAALFLLAASLVFLILAIVSFTSDRSLSALVFVVLTIVCALPGGYSSFVLYKAWRQKPGYQFSEISFDDS
eukprot:TRINITY_DN30905_c0_g1_i1.p3 TRINITY_DN30905_c0_g1~~TRINITY_DN30905_c0_g1_i1.p3  ORF type:complete len:116 (-),score=10.79 TRINITY_DN30905_c0_g1_i1:322-669(-)